MPTSGQIDKEIENTNGGLRPQQQNPYKLNARQNQFRQIIISLQHMGVIPIALETG